MNYNVGWKRLFSACCVLAFFGCSDGYDRQPISGSVNFDGKPVPVGKIMFDAAPTEGGFPDVPRATAEIRDGEYALSKSEGLVADHKYTVRIYGFDGQAAETEDGEKEKEGTPLFTEYKEEIQLLMKDKTKWDFNVPK